MGKPVLAVALLCIAGCNSDRDALGNYLRDAHPEMTAGVTEVISAFSQVARSTEPAETRIKRLDENVLTPYRAIIDRLTAFSTDSSTVKTHHNAYLGAAQRQLAAFQATRTAIMEERSLDQASGMIQLARADLANWIMAVDAEAEQLGLVLRRPETAPP